MINIALGEYGVKEIKGEKHNPTVVNYFKDIGFSGIRNDETAWCSCFINWVAMKSGKERSKKLNARSWLNIGEEMTKPMLGDVVIFWRGSRDSWKGHVGLYVNEDGDNINVLGGNQSNSVCIKPYPKNRILSIRRLSNE